MAETQYKQGDEATSSTKVTVSSSQATRASTDLAKRISSITDTAESTIIQGVVTKTSPMKLSKTKRKYYFGTVLDKSSSKRFVSFNTAIFDKMKTFHESSKTIELQNCSVQRSSFNNAELEIMLNNKTNISPSPKKFKVEDVDLTPNFTSLSQLATMSVNQVINISIKDSKIEEPTQVLAKTKTLTKQDCIVNDATGTNGIVLWEANVNKLEVGSLYRTMDVRVKEYNRQKYISLTPESIIEAISDIGEVQTAPTLLNVDEISPNIIEGEIVSLNYIEHYLCPICNTKMVQVSSLISQCNKCQSKSRLSLHKKYRIAKVQIKQDSNTIISVTLFNNTLQELVDLIMTKESIEETLLMHTDPIKVTVNSNNITVAVDN
uniref:Uncharacterized protein n=1 Tax=Amphimedon queenslandica TaxID=400682 RepID=A0A1X7UPF3_AMPQE